MADNNVMNNGENNSERTFTQSDVNAIVEDRLGRERKKYSDYDELKAKADKYDQLENANKTELQKERERADAAEAKLQSYTKAEAARQIREDVAKEKGIPAHLLTGATKEECEKQADELIAWGKPKTYPQTKRTSSNNTNSSSSENDAYREWARNMFGE